MREVVAYLLAMPVPLAMGLVFVVAVCVGLVLAVSLEAERQVSLHRTLASFLAQMGTYTRLNEAMDGASAMLCRATGASFALLYVQDSDQSPLVLKGCYPTGGLEGVPRYVDEPYWPKPQVGDVFLAEHCDLSLFGMPSEYNCAVLVAPIAAWERVIGYALMAWRSGRVPAGADRICMGVGQYLGVGLEHLLMYEALRAQALSSEEAAMDLRRLTQVQQETAQAILHDIRQPLFLARGYLDVVLSGLVEDGEIGRYVRNARAGVNRAAQMAEDLLVVDLPQRERLTLGPVDIEKLLKEVVDQATGLMLDSGVGLDVHVVDGTGQANADEKRLYRVLVNLLLNAVKHTAAGGRVMLQARPGEDGKVIVAVSDTGRGMPDVELQALLNSALDAPSGSGRLGLMIVRRLVTEMGATLVGRSEPGQGTCFEIALPRYVPLQQPGRAGVILHGQL